MSLIQRVAQAMERIAPLSLADHSWDNVGVLIEHPSPSGTGVVMLTIDLTPQVLAECIQEKVEVIVSYHPRFFSSTKSLTLARHSTELKVIAAGMSLYSPHTSLDAVEGGINDWLASLLQEKRTTHSVVDGEIQVAPIKVSTVSKEKPTAHPKITENCGDGRIVTLRHPIPFREVVNRIKSGLHLDHVRVAFPCTELLLSSSSVSTKGTARGTKESRLVQRIAICAGSGASVFRCITSPADILWTGEMSHHEVLAATAAGQAVILCEHTNTERGYLKEVLQKELEKELEGEAKVLVSSTDADPLFVW